MQVFDSEENESRDDGEENDCSDSADKLDWF
jgi:hypothetical protein